MSIPLFFAMTREEIQKSAVLPSKIAWMSCHFSPDGPGLVDLPQKLPPDSMLILDDRIALNGHNETLIAHQLAQAVDELRCRYLLLDFQREGGDALVQTILQTVPCPTGVTPPYADLLDCPVFLPPVPLHVSMEDYFKPWQGKEIWLEAALDGADIIVTKKGSVIIPVPFPEMPDQAHHSLELNCHYTITVEPERIRFSLFRTLEDLQDLIANARPHITLSAGLFQELRFLAF